MGALRRLAVAGVVWVCVLVGGLVFGGAGAFGAFTYPFDEQLAPSGGSFGQLNQGSVAVNDADGDTYVADSASGVVDVFETATGTELAPLDGSLTPAGSFGSGRVSVAVTVNNGTGDVYVLDSVHGVVDVFASSGGYVCQITGSASPSASECNGVAGSATPAGGFNAPGGITVDQATGDVYVADAKNGVVDIFSAGGEYLRQILLGSIEGGYNENVRGIAVDDFNGDVYVADGGPRGVFEFDAAGGYVTSWTGSNTPAGSFGGGSISVAADNASGDVYVTSEGHGVTDVFASSGVYLTQFSHSYSEPLDTAVDQASGRIYVANNFPAVIDFFGPGVVVPDVTTGAASSVGPVNATLNGTVNPDGIPLSDCHFDYGTTTSYGQSAPCVPSAASIPADSSEHAVTADLTGLRAGTTYHFRLEASNVNGGNPGGDEAFATPPPPSIENAATANLTGASVDLSAQVDPNGFDTTYRFEWGTSTAYGTSVPVSAADIGAGTSNVLVNTHLSGLSADTTYHWQVVATSANGTTATGDQTFIYSTGGGGGLPDGREYEMVTPSRKNGAAIGIVFIAPAPDIAENGSRVIMQSLQCFADAGSCTGSRFNEGVPFAFTRTSSGWVTTPLAPPATQFDVGAATTWLYSADAGTALFSIPNPSTGLEAFYAGQPGGLFSDVGPTGTGQEGIENNLVATADLSHVIYELRQSRPLRPTYEYVGSGSAAPALVGVSGGAGSTDLISECGTALGHGPESSFNTVSADGRTVFFTAEGLDNGSYGCPEGVEGVKVPATSELYARIDESRTVLVSGRSPLGCTGACLSSPASGAFFEGASKDGSKVFFTSTQQLTDNASEDSSRSATANRCQRIAGGVNGCNLYEYDFDNPAGRNLIAVSAGDTSGEGPRVQGIVALSPDGSHVYFVAEGVLSTVANSQGQTARDGADNLYVFERDASHPEGHIAFITIDSSGDWTGFPNFGTQANVTPDGRFLVFESNQALTADDTSVTGATQVFRYDAQTGGLVRISIGEGGFNDNGNAGKTGAEIVPADHFFLRAGPPRTNPTMSNDGSYVFFMSPVGLTPGALNEVPIEGGRALAKNVYEWHEGHVYLISDGREVGMGLTGSVCTTLSTTCLLGSDGTGANVFFMSADRLVPQDTDAQEDVYDARICTVSEPCPQTPAAPAPACQGEACHGAPGAAPALPGAGTVAFAGAGNLAAPAPVAHKKAVVKKHTKHKHKRRRRRPKRAKGARSREAAHGGGGQRGGRR
jgi:hypothetical protein